MSPENTQKLIESCPRLYPEDFYFECENGWFQLLLDLSLQLEAEINFCESPDIAEPCEIEFRATQVKEKYGTLRFYMTCSTDKMQDLIEEAEKKSQYICEHCSAPGTLTVRHGWWSVSCVECQLAKRGINIEASLPGVE